MYNGASKYIITWYTAFHPETVLADVRRGFTMLWITWCWVWRGQKHCVSNMRSRAMCHGTQKGHLALPSDSAEHKAEAKPGSRIRERFHRRQILLCLSYCIYLGMPRLQAAGGTVRLTRQSPDRKPRSRLWSTNYLMTPVARWQPRESWGLVILVTKMGELTKKRG